MARPARCGYQGCRNKAAIERLLAALCELPPAVAYPENAAAVDAVLAFADSQVAAAQVAAKRRKNSLELDGTGATLRPSAPVLTRHP
ncbi:MAG: hypothetical protein R2749_29715 [Acidimicrobiales bacterium]